MSDTSSELIAPATIRRLARLVTVLTVVMIVGMITVVGLLILKLNTGDALPVPQSLSVPDGAVVKAVTTTATEMIVLTEDRVLIYDRTSGALRASVALTSD
ncbi:MAG: DUF6476 family protein [Deltaproteobacteria bacterium]